ncbi:hypothetical protein [Cupriavidus sp. SS-3]|uniref:hypothetical protein n=1 Tax=Cupriavidus sp. SS-3 TaxID=3109596 RepID=UPI002DBD3713|nr:hypothetical protein [Cupriavidus sp. SS-3]MEC3764993.1 hypothetical protein [Cupriavidus sp. SS-3]
MDMQENRRRQLRLWLQGRTAPAKEKSYFSQLLNGASFGERAARRLERDYGMGEGFLDRPPTPQSSYDDNPKTMARRPGGSTGHGGWPFVRVTKEDFDALPDSVKEDIEDNVELLVRKYVVAKRARTKRAS